MTTREVAGLRSQLRHGLVAGLAHVHHERQARPPRQLDLGAEGAALRVPRREVAVEVEADFSDGDDPGPRRQLLELGQQRVVQQVRLVRMQADGRIHAVEGRGQLGGLP